MKVELELWQLIMLLIFFFGCVGAFGKVLLVQFDKSLNLRFKAQDEARSAVAKAQDDARTAGAKALKETLDQHMLDERKTSAQMISLERDFLTWKAELPLQYVRREDYVRNQTVIEAKLDALALRIENLQLKGFPHA